MSVGTVTVEARMRCNEKTERPAYGQDDVNVQVKLSPIRTGDPSDPTDSFATATPSGSLELAIQRKGAASAFRPGAVYRVLIEEVE